MTRAVSHPATVSRDVDAAWRVAPSLLVGNFSWMLAANLAYAASQWLILVVLARGTSPSVVGQYALALALTAPVISLSNSQLRSILATDSGGRHNFGEYLGLRLITSSLAFVVIACGSACFRYAPGQIGITTVVGLGKVLDSISDIGYGLCQLRGRMDFIAKSVALRGLLSLAVFAVAIAATRRLLWGLACYIAASAAVLMVYDLRSIRTVCMAEPDVSTRPTSWAPRWPTTALQWSPRAWRQLAALSLPLGIVMLFVTIIPNIPRYFLERLFGQEALGVYAMLIHPMMLGTVAVNALGQAAIPLLARQYSQGHRRAFADTLAALSAVAGLLGACAVLIAIFLGREVLVLLYGVQPEPYTGLLSWIAVSAALGYVASILGYGLTAMRCLRPQAWLFAVVTAAGLLSSALTIPTHALRGAVGTMVIVGIVQLVGAIALLRTAMRA